jgi:hypothetical protein
MASGPAGAGPGPVPVTLAAWHNAESLARPVQRGSVNHVSSQEARPGYQRAGVRLVTRNTVRGPGYELATRNLRPRDRKTFPSLIIKVFRFLRHVPVTRPTGTPTSRFHDVS